MWNLKKSLYFFISFLSHLYCPRVRSCWSICVSLFAGGIVNVMPLLFSQISHNKTQVSSASHSTTQHHTATRNNLPPFATLPAEPTTPIAKSWKLLFSRVVILLAEIDRWWLGERRGSRGWRGLSGLSSDKAAQYSLRPGQVKFDGQRFQVLLGKLTNVPLPTK